MRWLRLCCTPTSYSSTTTPQSRSFYNKLLLSQPTSHNRQVYQDLKKQASSASDPLPPCCPPTMVADKPCETRPENERPGDDDVPWPGKKFLIVEKQTGKAITLVDGRPVLLDLLAAAAGAGAAHDPSTAWLCVEKQGYFGFQNPTSGRFLGHGGKTAVGAWASELNEWELWTPRQHPEGGYQLLSPLWSHTLMVLCVAEDRIGLCRRTHGTTLWEFVSV
ncbi:hypothetical protein CTA2_12957 [Colletotrichum tanaceti]|uniref:Uncharacterized protein n=1 Tax=Colletotrichum tanaceti TaxID=1306861 RepID=A0A4U6XH18_9PEZI|nr:hypothetical protein CTA2_12957 [Colletotrichum tanaceti]TKW54582.1 hypothetical protein CTA1_8978 [Colletotrichum tanaceti]